MVKTWKEQKNHKLLLEKAPIKISIPIWRVAEKAALNQMYSKFANLSHIS